MAIMVVQKIIWAGRAGNTAPRADNAGSTVIPVTATCCNDYWQAECRTLQLAPTDRPDKCTEFSIELCQVQRESNFILPNNSVLTPVGVNLPHNLISIMGHWSSVPFHAHSAHRAP